MSQTLLVENNDQLKQILSINLTAYTGTDVVDRQDAEDVINLMKLLPTVDLIITRSTVGTENTAYEIIKFLDDSGSKIPVIVLGTGQFSSERVKMIPEPIRWEEVIRTSASSLGLSQEEMAKRVIPEYVPVPSKYFYHINTVCTDVYLKVEKSAGDPHFIKRINAYDTFDFVEIKKYETEGVAYFYIRKSDQNILVNFVSSKLSEQLEDDDMPLERRVALGYTTYEVVGHQLRTLGVTEATLVLVEACVDNLALSINKIPKLNLLLTSLLKNQTSLAFQLSYLTSVLCYEIMRKVEWGSQDHHKKLTFVSFLNDICLAEDRYLGLRSNQDLEKKKLTDLDSKRIMYHAARSADLIRDNDSLPIGVDTIIREHHGVRTGVGFVDEYTEAFSPMTNVFILSEELAFYILSQKPSNQELKQYIKVELPKKFKHKSYLEFINLFSENLDLNDLS